LSVDRFIELLATVATMPPSSLEQPWRWPAHPEGMDLDLRSALYLCLQQEQEAIATASPPEGEAARTLALSQAAYGSLRGLLAGLDDGLLDRSPGAGDWTLREVLAHILTTEVRYHDQVRYGADRSDEDPLRIELTGSPDTGGGINEWLDRMSSAREQTRTLGALPEAALGRPTVWVGSHVDIRFRLHRFAAHIREHTIHCEKTLTALGSPAGEPRQIARMISAARGAHEWASAGGVLERLDAGLGELELDRSTPARGQRPPEPGASLPRGRPS
jgi:uncharacterized damage-inducible protein DinB